MEIHARFLQGNNERSSDSDLSRFTPFPVVLGTSERIMVYLTSYVLAADIQQRFEVQTHGSQAGEHVLAVGWVKLICQ